MTNEFTRDKGVEKLLATVAPSIYSRSEAENLYSDVDNSQSRPNDDSMTDLTRQQVTDLLAASEAKVDARLANFESTINSGFSNAASEMASLRTDMHKMNAEIKTWTLATMLTIIGTMLAAIFGVATIFNNASKSAVPAAAPAPIVITVPSAQTTPAAVVSPAK